MVTDTPEEFVGTDTCPQCRGEYLIMEQKGEPYCFWCCREIPAEPCNICSRTKIVDVPCCEDDYHPHHWLTFGGRQDSAGLGLVTIDLRMYSQKSHFNWDLRCWHCKSQNS